MLSLKEQQEVTRCLRHQSRMLSVYSYSALRLWQDFFSFDFRGFDGQPCLFAHSPIGVFQFWPPLSDRITPSALSSCFDYMETVNGGAGITRIEHVALSQVRWFQTDYNVRLKGCEYLYRSKDIAGLKGNRYKRQRAAYNQFVKAYDFLYESFDVCNGAACLELYDQWMRGRQEKCSDDLYQQMLIDNRTVHKRLFNDFEQLDLLGRLIKVDNEVVAFTFGYPVRSDMFCVFCEIADLRLAGVAIAVFRLFCQELMSLGYVWINVMDDIGLPNIKRTKESFFPAALIPSYNVTRKE
ncbi:MAG: phosphatidylglycerol lysyltransferase domain-containing protein [Candidatus Omnitrophica bacterium]|nr:phosphatidylglycerol lysyltransferase domain-containing protein [Candidatus Omnitrophota bacterium]